MFTDEPSLQRALINRVMHLLYNISFDVSPPELGKKAFRLIKNITQNDDPFKEIKQKDNQTLL
jgi:uncharacterized protein with ATP-grasp and redox domains